MMEPFIGEISIFAGNYPPRGWAFCHGQQLAIAQNSALFALLGTTYGGDGVRTFALPDLRGRAAVGAGQGPGLPIVAAGEQGMGLTGHGTRSGGTLGLNYIIALEGIWPARD